MTPKQIKQINRGIAEKLGWTCINSSGQFPVGFNPNIKGPAVAKVDRVPSFYSDERTRPQLLAALDREEKLQLICLALESRKQSVKDSNDCLEIFELTQSDLCKLFCAVKNIEIDL
jgi:hypothetical protein